MQSSHEGGRLVITPCLVPASLRWWFMPSFSRWNRLDLPSICSLEESYYTRILDRTERHTASQTSCPSPRSQFWTMQPQKCGLIVKCVHDLVVTACNLSMEKRKKNVYLKFLQCVRQCRWETDVCVSLLVFYFYSPPLIKCHWASCWWHHGG